MRIRGYDESTNEFIGGVEVLDGKIANLTKTAENGFGGVSLFADEAKTTFKSTTQILRDISEVWDDLTDKNQARVLEALASKRQGQVVAAILNNFQTVEDSLNTMQNSTGNAMQEMSIIQDSIEYKINAFSQTATGIWQNLFKRSDIGAVIDLFMSFLSIIDKITDHFGLLGTAVGITAGILSAKFGVGELINQFYLLMTLRNEYAHETFN